MRILLTLTIGLAIALLTGANTQAQLSYDESVDGDLSDSFGMPSQLVFSTGTNTITGNTGSFGSGGSGATNGSDADYFWFSLGAGETVDSITTTRSGPGSQSFIGYVNSNAFGGQTSNDLDANTLFSNNESLLPGGLSNGVLSEGNHAFWIQETAGATDYSISFNVVSAVPEPSSVIAMLGLGIAGIMRRRRSDTSA